MSIEDTAATERQYFSRIVGQCSVCGDSLTNGHVCAKWMRPAQDSGELTKDLAAMLGVSAHNSTDSIWHNEMFKRRVLRRAIVELKRAWGEP